MAASTDPSIRTKFLSMYSIGGSAIRTLAPPTVIALRTRSLIAGGIFFQEPHTIRALPRDSSTAVRAAVAMPEDLASRPTSFSSATAICLGVPAKLAKQRP